MSEPASRVLTIMLTDIRGFTDRTAHSSRSDIRGLIQKHKELVLPVLERRGGRLIKSIGDAFLVVFDSPTDAVLAGTAVQGDLGRYNAERPESERIEVRIAINVGEVTLLDNDIFGDPVNITARIETVAVPGEVFFTEAVYLAMNKTEVPSSDVGYLQLKGIPEKIRVYKVKRELPLGDLAPAPETAAPGLLEEPAPKARMEPGLGAAPEAPAAALGAWDRRGWALAAPALVAVALAVIVFRLRGNAGFAARGPCGTAIARYCSDVPPGKGRQFACAREHADELSTACAEAAFRNPPKTGKQASEADQARRSAAMKPCAADIKRLCADVEPGGGRLLKCLWERWDQLSPACRQARTALWKVNAAIARP